MEILAPAAATDRGCYYNYQALHVACVVFTVCGHRELTKPSRMEASSWRVVFDIQEEDILCLLIVGWTNYSVGRVAG